MPQQEARTLPAATSPLPEKSKEAGDESKTKDKDNDKDKDKDKKS